MSESTTKLQEQFAEWLLLPESRRGEVSSEAEWARRMKVSDRTLRRWKGSPQFAELLDRVRAGLPAERAVVADVAPVVDGDVPGDEADYRVVKSVLVTGAKQGNPKYLEMYFRTYGKPFVDEEAASRSTDLAGLDLEDLVARALVVLGEGPVVRFLESQGWSVVRSDGDSVARV